MGALTESVKRLNGVVDSLKKAIIEKGGVIDDDKKLNEYPKIIKKLKIAKPVSEIKIKHYSGKTLDWIADGDAPHRLELEKILPSDATVDVRDLSKAKVKWLTSDPKVVKIVESEGDDGAKNYDAVVVRSGQCKITASFMGVEDSFNVSMEYSSDFHILKKLLQNGESSAKTRFPIGSEIPSSWTDTTTGQSYDFPWIVVHYGDVEKKDGSISSGVYLMAKNIVPFDIQFNKASADLPREKINAYYKQNFNGSAVHQWLNSKKSKGEWWSNIRGYDLPIDIASTKDGLMKGCQPALLDAIEEIKVITNKVPEKTSGKFFLPSLDNLNGNDGGLGMSSGNLENGVWDYFSDKGSSILGKRTRKKEYFTRTVHTYGHERVFSIASDGAVSGGSYGGKDTERPCGVCPACAIVP